MKLLLILCIFLALAAILLIIASVLLDNSKDDNKNNDNPPSPPPSPPSEQDPNKQQWLDAHNNYRNEVEYNNLEWDDDLASQSKNYANKLASTNKFEHGDLCNPNCKGSTCSEGGNRCGQNLEKATPTTNPQQSVDNWFSEKSKYLGGASCDQRNMECLESAGHYTQVMWRDATKVGCGISDNNEISSCLYDKGNLIGGFSSNVPE